MSRQAQKYHLNLAGEFFVAAELQRRSISAAVTYGNAKNADVVAFSLDGQQAVVIEVKTTSERQWVVGAAVPEPSSKPWVFVYLPPSEDEGPSYSVLTQAELHGILKPIDEEYDRKFLAKHGVPYGDRAAVINFSQELALPYKSAWHTVLGQLHRPSQRPTAV